MESSISSCDKIKFYYEELEQQFLKIQDMINLNKSFTIDIKSNNFDDNSTIFDTIGIHIICLINNDNKE